MSSSTSSVSSLKSEYVHDASARVSLVGDVLVHSNMISAGRRSGDLSFSRQFEQVKEHIQASAVSSANLESIAAGARYGISGFPKFNSPEQVLDGLKEAGFDVLSVANNHMLDKGEKALLASLENIDKRGLLATGASDTEEGLAEGAVVGTKQARVGFVSFTDAAKIDTASIEDTSINHFPGEFSSSRLAARLGKIKARVKRMRESADIVVLQLHFGEEYHRNVSAFQRDLVTSICELDVDVIVGHHPHVLQPIEWIENSKGRRVLVAYSLGNFFSGQSGIYRQIGGIFNFSLKQHISGGRALYSVTDPGMVLTYVDHQEEFAIRRLSDVADEGREFVVPRSPRVKAGVIYDGIVDRMRGGDKGIDIE